MDSEYSTCGTCRHGNLYDHCGKCEDEYEARRSKPVAQPVQPSDIMRRLSEEIEELREFIEESKKAKDASPQ